MAGELFRLNTGTPLTHVAYKGMGPAVTDLLAGQIDLCFGSVTAVQPHLGDKLRGLATTAPSARRCCRACRRSRKPGWRASMSTSGSCCWAGWIA